jgi:hypothetical protein
VAHCPPELLDDLTDVFDTIRTWAGVAEKSPGVFYVRRQPFLHFHLLAGGQRRGDVKGRTTWVQLDLPYPVTTRRRQALLRELRARHRERVPAEKRARPSNRPRA